MMLPLFKKSHIHSRHIEDILKTGHIAEEYADENNKRNALRQASLLYRIVDNELFRHGTEREYEKYGLRLVVHDDQPEKKAEVIAKCHLDSMGNHLGMNVTIRNVCDTYYWQGISAHVKMYLKQCGQCKNRSKFNAEEWLEIERKNINKKKAVAQISVEAKQELRNLGRVKRPTPPETFFIVNAERKVNLDSDGAEGEMMIDSNNIEYVVETLGQSDGIDLEEVCHVLNVPDILQVPDRFRSREIEAFLRDGSYPSDFTANMKCGLRGPASQYKIIDDELYHEGNKVGSKGLRLVIHDDLPALKVKVMVECHIDDDGSHHGLNKTLNRISEKYYWTGMSVDVRKFMLQCKICSESRGRRIFHDGRQYEQEAQEVKSRHMKKMNDAEAAVSDAQLGANPVSYDSTDIEPAEGLEQEGHQVIRLIGPNKEVTEITVAVVNQETVTAENAEPNKMIKEGEDSDEQFDIIAGAISEGHTLVTKEMTDAVAQIEAVEAAMELAEFKNQENVRSEEVNNDGEVKNTDDDADFSQTDTEGQVENEGSNTTAESHNKDSCEVDGVTGINVNKEEVSKVDGEMTQIETQGGIVNVLIIKDGEQGQEIKTEVVDNDMLVDNAEANRMAITEGHAYEEIVGENTIHPIVSPLSGSYYKDVIFVPGILKTRIIENFLKLGVGAEGFSHSTLIEMSANYEIVDDILYRRPSRYKGRQIILHDDTPELKYKFISEAHVKRNGTHSSEVITLQNVSFKYFWEEMKWDVHRYYSMCKTCVNEDGIERRSKKKILTVEEQKMMLEQKRRENRMSSARILSARTFRNKMKQKIYEIQHPQIYQMADADIKKMGGVEIKGTRTNPVSDTEFELSIPGLAEEGKAHLLKVKKKPQWNVLYDLMIYATLKQEQCIKEMYAKKGWKYNMLSLSRAMEEEFLNKEEDLYLLTLKVTSIQENAIIDLFKEMGLAIQATDDSNKINLSSPDITEATDEQRSEPSVQKSEVDDDNKKEESMKSTSLELQKHLQESAETKQTKDLVPIGFEKHEHPNEKLGSKPAAVVRKSNGIEPYLPPKIRKINTADIVRQLTAFVESPKKNSSNNEQVSTPVQPTRRFNILSKSPVKPEKATVVKNVSPVKADSIRITNIESPTKAGAGIVSKNESPVTPEVVKVVHTVSQSTPVDKSTTKRKFIETPASESRRPRREIKKPRRFSPDTSPPPKSSSTKTESQSHKLDEEKNLDKVDKTELLKTPKLSQSRGKEALKVTQVISSPEKHASDTPKAGPPTSTRFTQKLPSEPYVVKEQKKQAQVEEVDMQHDKKRKEATPTKVKVMSKVRIKVKKVPKELNPVHLKLTEDENLTSHKKNELDKDVMNSDEESQDDVANIIDELDHDDDDDEFNYDDNEFSGDDSDDDDDDDDETESMKLPLHIVLNDSSETMVPVEVGTGYACSLCDAKFPNKSRCIQHGQRSNCMFECELCGVTYKKKDQALFKSHVEQHKKSRKYPCKKCKKSFFSDEHLKIHSRSHCNEIVTKCDICKEEFYTWFQYAAHMVSKHKECNMFTCDVCNAKFASINFLKSEMKFDGKLSYFRCIMCDQ